MNSSGVLGINSWGNAGLLWGTGQEQRAHCAKAARSQEQTYSLASGAAQPHLPIAQPSPKQPAAELKNQVLGSGFKSPPDHCWSWSPSQDHVLIPNRNNAT